LPRDSVVNVTALVTLNKLDLTERVGRLSLTLMNQVNRGLLRALGL
jgi:mRNA interferase MazF